MRNKNLFSSPFLFSTNKMKTLVEEKFSEFFEKWLCQLEELVQQLLKVSTEKLNEAELRVLVSMCTTHYKEYYTVKWAGAREDVLAFFCPVWLSPLENACSWVTGWKPSTAFLVIDSLRKNVVPGATLEDMSDDQMKKIDLLKGKIRVEKEKIERGIERQQVSMADWRMVDLARMTVRSSNGDGVAQVDQLVEVALKGLLGELERVMKAADCVRLKTLKGVLEVLNPLQCVIFLATICTRQIGLRQRGKKQENQNEDRITEEAKLV